MSLDEKDTGKVWVKYVTESFQRKHEIKKNKIHNH